MTDIILERILYGLDGVFGLLYDNDMFFAYTLEHSYGGIPKLPVGVYVCKLGKHELPKLGPITTYEVLNVPNHSGILFHPGNSESDSEGCILLGKDMKNNCLVDSRKAFNLFIEFLDGKETFNLEVKNNNRGE